MSLSSALPVVLLVSLFVRANCEDDMEDVGRMGSSSEVDAFYAGHYGNDPFVIVDGYLQALADSIGFPVDQIRTIGCLLLAYPLALIHRTLPTSPSVKHLYSIFWGVGFSWLCFGVNTLVPLLVALAAYAGAFVLPPTLYPKVVFVGAMGVLSFMHIYRLMIDWGGYSLDVTGPLMVVTLKVIAFAYNVADFEAEAVAPRFASRAQRAVNIKECSVLEYLGYIFFFGGYLAGPTFEFADYKAFTNLSLYEAKSEEDRPPPEKCCSCCRCPDPTLCASLPAALTQVLVAFACMGVFVGVAGAYFPLTYLFTDAFMEWSLPLRCLYAVAAVNLQRSKYYFVWSLANGALVMVGLGFNGRDKEGKMRWDRCKNANIMSVELAQSPHELMGAWNRSVNHFLRYYVYERVQEAGFSTGLSTLATFMVSAFWHGFYAGYYISFFAIGCCTVVARQLRGNLRPHFEDTTTRKTPLWYNMAGLVCTQVICSLFALPFMILSLGQSWEVYSRLYFAPIVLGVSLVVALNVLKMQGSHKKKVADYKAATQKKSK